MKTVIFDLGGVLFGRNQSLMTEDIKEFFSFLAIDPTPDYWNEYDRGVQTIDETAQLLAKEKNLSEQLCKEYVYKCIELLAEIKPTETLIEELHNKGFKLYVLSNMSFDFIEHLRTKPVYKFFDGEVVSCQHKTIKPERSIYEKILGKYNINPAEALFIDDRPLNIETGKAVGLNTYLFDRYNAENCCKEIRDILYK
ncbi:MAG: HAD family phosphatase [Rikenellaceae bacterium]